MRDVKSMVMPDAARMDESSADVVVIGGGVAGLSLALRLPTQLSVVLVTKEWLGESNTRYAQGGLAAAVGSHDSTASHLSDTLAAGAGHCDPLAARILVEGAPDAVTWLVALGATFDPAGPGALDTTEILGERLALGHEAAHSHHRVLHAQGDATGAELERALVEAVRARPNVRIIERCLATELIARDGMCIGVRLLDETDQPVALAARAVVLANGGSGRAWHRTTNPAGATADGLALAWHAGAVLTDLEFMQFHPTALVPPDPAAPAFLISEAVRGEGAYLRNNASERFMLRYEAAEMEPRDVVARAIAHEMLREESDCAWLDLRHLDADFVRQRFPTIAAACASYGIDITRDFIPVAPAAHYFMGGVAVDLAARTTVPGLWAVGEVACTGVHGANRLASNSLLEGLVFGRRAAESIAADLADPAARMSWPVEPRLGGVPLDTSDVHQVTAADPDVRQRIQGIMWERVGLFRDAEGMADASHELADLAARASLPQKESRGTCETASILLAGQLIAAAALARTESRGAHARTDFPLPSPQLAGYHFLASQTGSSVKTIDFAALDVRGDVR
jgi:L-aspartate oxidase